MTLRKSAFRWHHEAANWQPLRWTCKSVRKLTGELRVLGHEVGAQKVSELLHELGYSLQGTRKTREGSAHPDRNAQFEHINAQAKAFSARASRWSR